MTERTKIKMRLYGRVTIKVFPGYAIIFAFLVLISFIYGNPISIGFLLVAFVSLRYAYDGSVTYHCERVPPCIAATCLVFATAGLLLIPLNMGISILAPVPVALGITWLLHIGGKYKEDKKKLDEKNKEVGELKQEIEEIKREIDFKKKAILNIQELQGLSEAELDAYCKSKGLNDKERKIARLEFYEQIKLIKILEKMYYSRSQLWRYRKKMYKKLGHKLNKNEKEDSPAEDYPQARESKAA